MYYLAGKKINKSDKFWPFPDIGLAHEDRQDGLQTFQENHQKRISQLKPRAFECLLVNINNILNLVSFDPRSSSEQLCPSLKTLIGSLGHSTCHT